jgi:hypothetical protein
MLTYLREIPSSLRAIQAATNHLKHGHDFIEALGITEAGDMLIRFVDDRPANELTHLG